MIPAQAEADESRWGLATMVMLGSVLLILALSGSV
jgi:hypothetical protein